MSSLIQCVRARNLIVSLTALAVVGFAGCSEDPPASDTSPSVGRQPSAGPPSTASSSSPSENVSSPSPSTSASSSSGPSSEGNSKALIEAGAAAEKAVKDSSLISIEHDDNQTVWEVQVVTSKGVEYEMDLSVDDTSTVKPPRADDEDAKDRAKHKRRSADTRIDYREAAETLDKTVKNGTIEELNVDTWRGKTVWEADVRATSGTKHEMKIDARSGKLSDQS